MAAALETIDGAARDPLTAPFGAFTMSPTLARLRALALADWWPGITKLWAYKIFSHFTKGAGHIVDIEFMGMKRRLFVDEFAHDRAIFRKGTHPEVEELATLDAFAGQDAVFLDIGSNNGFFSVRAATLFAPTARIHAFEPHPRTYAKLALHVAMNNARTVTTHNVALGPDESRMMLRLASDDGSHSLLGKRDEGVEVAVRPLLAMAQEAGLERIDLIKIDVEGFEDGVLCPFFAEAPDALLPKLVLIETIHGARSWKEDVLAAAARRGYRIDKQNKDNTWLARPAS